MRSSATEPGERQARLPAGLQTDASASATCRRPTARGSAARVAPTSTAEAWIERACAGDLRAGPDHIAGRRTTKRETPSTFAAAFVRRRRDASRFSAPTARRHAPRRSAGRSTGRARNSGRSPGAAGRCRSARKSSPCASGRMPGPSSSTTISTLVPQAAAGHAHAAVWRRERAGIVDQVVDHLAEPQVVARHRKAARRLRTRARP